MDATLARLNAKTATWAVFRGHRGLFFLTYGQKEGFSHQLHTESESVGKHIALGDAVHLVHAVLELFERFLLLVRERTIQFFAIPGDELK